MVIRAGVLFFTIYEINYNSNKGKERRKGVYVLTMRKIDGFLHVKNNHKRYSNK